MVERRYLPMWDLFDDHAPGVLTWVQAWYATQCDGDWEHGQGIRIGTLDNPGWSVSIELSGTRWATQPLPPIQRHRSEHDWVDLRLANGVFEAACGPLNLGEVLHEFRLWVEGPLALAT